MLKRRDDENVVVTVCGEFFPEVYPAFRSPEWSRGEEDPLLTEMRLFCACERWAFNRLLEGVSRDEVKRRAQSLFGLNSRYADDARLRTQAMLESRKALLEVEMGDAEEKLRRARRKLRLAEQKLARCSDCQKAERLRRAVNGRKARVASLERKLAGLKKHQENGTVPPVVFGGRKLWQQVCKGRATLEEWHAARKGRLFSRGDETKGGNPNVKVSHRGGEFRLSVVISHLSEERGADALGRSKMTRAPRVEGRVWLPQKHRDLVRLWLAAGLPYSAELARQPDGRFILRLAFDLGEVPAPDLSRGMIGLDINPDGVALCNVSPDGQPEPWPEGFEIALPAGLGKFPGEFQAVLHKNGFGYLRIPDLGYARSARRDYLIGVLAKAVVEAAERLGKPLALEGLDFSQGRMDTDRGFNRMASNFPYAKVAEAVCRRAARERVGFKAVPARHTSVIGHWKYAQRHAVPVHCAAALAVGRRALGFRERVTREIKEKVALIKRTLTQKVGSLPREGTGMTRRVWASLGRLDGKLLLYNGLCRWRQEGWSSVWGNLKILALVLR